jgi:mannose-6-phosphate isomerase-like protein (cupin superfamily)
MSADRQSSRSLAGDEYYTDERCHILELLNSPDFPDASIARARVEPGITTKRHCVVGTVERYLIMEGSGLARVEDSGEQPVGPGDVIVIPAGAAQSIFNSGDRDLVFLCVCTPRFEWDNYESLE